MKKLLIVIVKSITLAAENGCMASCSIAKRHDSLPKSFATRDVSEWLTQFEICSNANGWNNER